MTTQPIRISVFRLTFFGYCPNGPSSTIPCFDHHNKKRHLTSPDFTLIVPLASRDGVVLLLLPVPLLLLFVGVGGGDYQQTGHQLGVVVLILPEQGNWNILWPCSCPAYARSSFPTPRILNLILTFTRLDSSLKPSATVYMKIVSRTRASPEFIMSPDDIHYLPRIHCHRANMVLKFA